MTEQLALVLDARPCSASLPDAVARAAVLSPCGRYRYRLERTWDRTRAPVVFVMLNPSTADATVDDPTIRRCVGFARAWGHGGILVAAQRSGVDVVGPDNDRHIVEAVREGACVVAAWGARGGLAGRDAAVHELLRDTPMLSIRVTKQGHPEHPLYLPANLTPTPMDGRRA